MAGQAGILDSPEQRARWEGFQWTDANARLAKEIRPQAMLFVPSCGIQ